MQKISENFSNYSAFHHRSVLLKASLGLSREVLESELYIVENAIFTEPGINMYVRLLFGIALI